MGINFFERLWSLRRKLLLLYLSSIYRFYPASRSFDEYRIAEEIGKEMNCRKVLDLGCGKGNLGKILDPPDLYLGLDLSEIFELDGRRNYVKGSMELLPLRQDEPFDCAFFINSVFYSDWKKSILEASRASRAMVLIDIDKKYPHIWLLDFLEGSIRKRPHDIKEEMEKMGFETIVEKGGSTFALVFRKRERDL
ncbi:MAG: class I SAM-dependent methyltransferase [Fervidicoccaceae archaeon]|jgi:SAM-dependent methyltransferase|nr:MAG: hypothetical protein C0179_00815 [Fervidicoccus sp.]